MKTIAKLLLGLGSLININSFSQETVKHNQIKTTAFTSQFLLSTDFDALYLNFVGGSIKYSAGVSSISITVFPSLRLGNAVNEESASDPLVVPGLAIGPLFSYRKLMLAAPIFYHGEWLATFGVGVKIGK